MECFLLFDIEEEKLLFHAEYCTERAVHTADGVVNNTEKLYEATGTSTKEELLRFLTNNYSTGDGFFAYLNENGISFSLGEKSYADTSSDV